jgi:hypothetical protein
MIIQFPQPDATKRKGKRLTIIKETNGTVFPDYKLWKLDIITMA